MAAKIEQDFTLRRGTVNTIRVAVDDGAAVPAVKDISGATAIVWSLGNKRDSTANKIQKTLGSGITLATDGTDGLFDVSLSAADLADLRGAYFHDAAVTLAGVPQIVAEGTVTILQSLSL